MGWVGHGNYETLLQITYLWFLCCWMLYIGFLQEEMRWKGNHQRIKISFEEHHTYLTFTAGELFASITILFFTVLKYYCNTVDSWMECQLQTLVPSSPFPLFAYFLTVRFIYRCSCHVYLPLFLSHLIYVETGFSFPFFLSVFCRIHTLYLLRLISPLFIFDPYFPTSRLGNIGLGKYRWPFDNANRRNLVVVLRSTVYPILY